MRCYFLFYQLNQSGHSPLTKAFSPTELPLIEYFLYFWSFSINSRDGYMWKSQIISFWNIQISPSGTNNHATFKLTYIPFLPHSDAQFDLQWIVLTMQMHQVAAMWFSDMIFALMNWTGVANKVAGECIKFK